MSLNDIKLSPHLLATLYPNSLYDLYKATEKPAATFLGNNQKNVLVLVNYSDAKYIPDATMPFFLKLVSACKLSMQDIALINIATQPSVPYSYCVETLKAAQCICFDISPAGMELPISFPQYQVQHFNGCNYVYADGLSELENNAESKKKLWQALQKMFLL